MFSFIFWPHQVTIWLSVPWPGTEPVPSVMDVQMLNHWTVHVNRSVMSNSLQLFATVDCQPPLSMEFSRQEYWSALLFPSPGGLLDPGIEPRSPALQADSLPSEPPGKPQEERLP